MEFVGGVIVAIIGAIGGILLDRRFQQRDLQREIAVDLFKYTDDLWPFLREALSSGRDEVEVQNEIDRMTSEVMSRVDLLASDHIRAAADTYKKEWLKATHDAIWAFRHGGRELAVAVNGQQNALSPYRADFVNALRAELREKWWQRRKTRSTK